MALHARCRVYSAVDLVLTEVVSPVRHVPLNRILEFVARFQFFLVRVAVRAEGLFVAGLTGLALLLCIEPVPRRVIAGMVQCRPPVLMAVAAHRRSSQFNGVLRRSTDRMGTGIDSEEHR